MAAPSGSAYVGISLQAGVSLLGTTYPQRSGSLSVTVRLTSAGSSQRIGQATLAVSVAIAVTGTKVRIPYRPDLLQLFKIAESATVGTMLRAGVSKLGEVAAANQLITNISGIKLTDGYDTSGDNNVLSIDPLTGSATISERIHPARGDRVEVVAGQHDLYIGDMWELRYSDAIVAQGVVVDVETRMMADGQDWVKRTEYVLGGWASRMLGATVEWQSLPAEGALTRLKRFFPNVDTTLLSASQRVYLDSVTADSADDPGSSTLLDQARAFSELTKFPVRTGNNMPSVGSLGMNLVVVPAVTFQGAEPQALYLPPASTWTLDAGFLSGQARTQGLLPPEKVQTVEVVKNFDTFIFGVGKQALEGGQVGLSFMLGTTKVGGGVFPVDVGVRTPAVVSMYGTTKVISRIDHEFTSSDYRSSLDLTIPAVIS